jgi:hypothetical protein
MPDQPDDSGNALDQDLPEIHGKRLFPEPDRRWGLGPIDRVNDVLNKVQLGFIFGMVHAQQNFRCSLERVPQQFRDSDTKACRDGLWKTLWELDRDLGSILDKPFQTLFEIGLNNSAYGLPDPAHWAYEKVRTELCRCSVVDELISAFVDILNDADETCTSVLTDFWLESEHRLDNLLTDAEIQLARRGWKFVNDVMPGALVTPEGDCCWWCLNTRTRVWRISCPKDPRNILPVPHRVGLAYLQVVLRESPKELLATRVQALVPSKSSAPFAPPGNNTDEGGTDWDNKDHLCTDSESRQPLFDSKYMYEVKTRLEEIEVAFDEAKEKGDKDKIEKLTIEKEKILQTVKKGMGKQKRSRLMGSHEERAANTVGREIRRAIKMISDANADIGNFFYKYIKTGRKVSYIGPEVTWRFNE